MPMNAEHKEEMTEKEARNICQGFAKQVGVVFIDKGECGFGRDCVGFVDATDYPSYIDHNPIDDDLEYLDDFMCGEAWPPEGVEAYHKHDCLSVLGHGKKAITQLAQWVLKMVNAGKVSVVKYQKTGRDLKSHITGDNTGYTIMITYQE